MQGSEGEDCEVKTLKSGLNPLLSKSGVMRRNAAQIIAEILSVASNGVHKTRIIYRANLNAVRAERYIRYLIVRGFLSVEEGPNGGVYNATEKGREWLSRYRELEERLEGLNKSLLIVKQL